MSLTMEQTESVSVRAIEHLIESYLHAPSPELAATLRSLLGEWSEVLQQPLPPHVLENVLEQTPVAISITDLDADILYTNSSFTEVTGYTPDEILGQNESVLSYKSTPPEVYRDLWQTLNEKRRWSGTLVNRRKDGSRYLAEVQITPILDEEGMATHYLGIHRDITELFTLESQVSNQKALIESVVDSTPAAMAVLDTEMKVLLDNQAYKQLAGDMRGDEPAHVLMEKMSADYTGFASLMASQGSFHNYEVACQVRGNTELRWFSCSGIWFSEQKTNVDAFFSRERVSYLLLVAHEITAQKQQQEVIRRNAMRALLAEEGLLQGMRETLTAAIFQLETPFNMLNAALEMLERRAAGSALDESLRNVLGEVRQQGIQTLENLRNAVPRTATSEASPLNLNQLIHDVLLVSTDWLLAEGIVIDWKPKADLQPIIGWETKLRSIIKQLLDNAVEAIVASESVEREISIVTEDEDGWVMMSISDTGEGVDEALRIKVFEPFFSTRETRGKSHAGMGLSLAQEVVNQHAGTIDIDPEYSRGCCIQVRIPAARNTSDGAQT